jgi:hypothetical protein
VELEKQKRNVNTKRTKRTKKKESSAWGSIEWRALDIDRLWYDLNRFEAFFFVRFVRFVFQILSFLLSDIRHHVDLA